jgi:hypothetical protein
MAMDEIIPGLSTPNLANVLEANLGAHARLYSQLPSAIFYDEPTLLGLMTGLKVSENCAYRAIFPPEQANEKIEQVVQRYRSQGCLPMWWIVGPSTQPNDLGRYLEGR